MFMCLFFGFKRTAIELTDDKKHLFEKAICGGALRSPDTQGQVFGEILPKSRGDELEFRVNIIESLRDRRRVIRSQAAGLTRHTLYPVVPYINPPAKTSTMLVM